MNDKDVRQHLESCLHLEQERERQDVAAFKQLLKEFETKLTEILTDSSTIKFFLVNEAYKKYDSAKQEVINNRIQINSEIRNSIIRITGGIFLLYLTFIILSGIKSTIDNQFCQFYNVQGRTQRYETQKPCER